MKSILITGGTGLIGKSFIKSIDNSNYGLYVLTRSNTRVEEGVNYINWDPENGQLDLTRIKQINYVINLAGASIDGSRWTKNYKNKILNSRINSTKLLFKKIKELNNRPELYIGASATGYYKKNTIFQQDEKDHRGKDFLSNVVEKWEKESLEFKKLGIRTTIFRIGLVLSEKGGVLKKLYPIFKFFLGVPIGNGKQIISWIHIKDLIDMIKESMIKKEYSGVYNAVAPNVITNEKFTHELSNVLNRPSYPKFLKAPSFIIKLLFGELSSLVLNGLNISSKKIQTVGFKYSYESVSSALKNIYSN
tara:strand:+ start:6328 stop:7242 length:915 start_codon:yes stop_codon:yes gene_type:complete